MKENILIIDDNNDFRATIINLLKKKGYDVFGAYDSLEALEMIKKRSFALIISDVRLPGLDGIALMTNILNDSDEKIIKTMIITGYADKDAPIKAIKLGVDDFIYKPFKMEVFLHSVDKLIKGYRLEKSVKYYKRLSIIDGLTEIFNHRYFHEIISREINRSNRYSHPLSLLMIDIDNFKQFNDTYGHLSGDSALKKIAHIFITSFRNIDLAFRYGGEEFAILIPETDKAASLEAADRIIKNVRNTQFEVDTDTPAQLTISIGTACYPNHAKCKEELIKKADEALYKAKNLGKNKAC